MPILHQVQMIDNGKGGSCKASDLVCVHCGKHLEPHDAFSVISNDAMYCEDKHQDRSGFTACKGDKND